MIASLFGVPPEGEPDVRAALVVAPLILVALLYLGVVEARHRLAARRNLR